MSRSGETSRERLLRIAARAGHVASIGVVFASGWFAMRSTDWKTILLLTVLAGGAGVMAVKFRQLGS